MAEFYSVLFGNTYNVLFGNFFPGGVAPSFTTDASSGKAVPANSTEWTSFLASFSSLLSAPQHLWSMQQASTPATDSIGTNNLTVTNLAFQKAIPGWARVAIGGSSQVAGTATNTALVNTATTSFLVLMYTRYDTVTVALRGLNQYGTPLLQIPDNKIRLREGGALASTVNAHDTTVHPLLWAFNVTNSTLKLYTDLEKLSITFSASTGSSLTFTGSSVGDPGFSDFLYAAAWDGVAGETTDAEAKKLITALGYSPPWT